MIVYVNVSSIHKNISQKKTKKNKKKENRSFEVWLKEYFLRHCMRIKCLSTEGT